ncbi:MAG: ribosome biogenesis GTP-binding protein YihA/YsxC [Mariniphaga sp.]
MIIKKAEFVISNTDPELCPLTDKPEFAFVGRSNVGKSSLINMITGFGDLAKVSTAPGKTRLINHFNINDQWFLVDLPGYGYAKVGRSSREQWLSFIRKYMEIRENLYCVFALIDSRHKPQANDVEFMNYLGYNEIPFAMVFTKADKLSRKQLDKNLAIYKGEMLKTWEELPPLFVTSSGTKLGRDELLGFIDNIISPTT